VTKQSETLQKYKQMELLTSLLGRRRYSESTLAYMVSLFDSVPAERFTEAVEYITKNSTELPTMSDILEGINAGIYRKVNVVNAKKVDMMELYRKMDQADLAMTDAEYAAHVESFGGDYEIPGVDAI